MKRISVREEVRVQWTVHISEGRVIESNGLVQWGKGYRVQWTLDIISWEE